MNFKLIAEVYRLGLLIKFFKVEEVINWVDKVIEISNVEYIPYKLFDLSLARDKKEILDILDSIKGEFEEGLPTKIMLGLLYRKWEVENFKTIIEMANNLAYVLRRYGEEDDLLFSVITAHVDQYNGALGGYGDSSCSEEAIKGYVYSATETLKEVLSEYEEYGSLF